MKLFKALSVVLIALAVFGGCKRGPTAPRENTLRVHQLNEPGSIDPNISSDAESFRVIMDMFEGLTRYNPKTMEPLPGVAERWDVSPDGRVYTFYLRKEAKWSDGSPVTAHDFIFSWERMLNPNTGASYAFILYPVKNAEGYNTGKIRDPKLLGIEAAGDRTLKVTLEKPTPYFLTLTAFGNYYPLPAKTVNEFGNKWTRPENILCNGPFKLASWVSQKEIVMEKNPSYWGRDEVSLDKITFILIEDADTAFRQYISGEIDTLASVPPLKVAAIRDNPDTIRQPLLSVSYFKVNTTRPPLTDIRVRRALGLAIDRKMAMELLRKDYIPIGNAVPNGLAHYISPPGVGFDPAEAKRLLAEAGFADPAAFPKLTLHYSTSKVGQAIVEIVQSMWKKNLGIDVKLLNEEWKVYLKTQERMDYDLSQAAWIGDYIDPNTFLDFYTSGNGMNHTGWQNPEFDRLIQTAAITQDTGQRMKILSDAEGLLLKEMPMIPISQQTAYIMVKPYVEGYYPSVMDYHPHREVRIRR